MLSHGLSSAHMLLIVPLHFMGPLLEALPPVLLQRALFLSTNNLSFLLFWKLTPCLFCISFMQHHRMTPWRHENSISTHVTCSSSPRDSRFTWISFAIIQTHTFWSNHPTQAKAQTRPGWAGVASWQRRASGVGSRPVCVPQLESELWWISSRYFAQHMRIKSSDSIQFLLLITELCRVQKEEQPSGSGFVILKKGKGQSFLNSPTEAHMSKYDVHLSDRSTNYTQIYLIVYSKMVIH